MGMFDDLICEYPLPKKYEKYQSEVFQTKSLNNCMDKYVINKDGELIHHSFKWDMTPEEERPYYNKPEWDKLKFIGSFKAVPQKPVKVYYTGEIKFYHSAEKGEIWIDLIALFVRGKLIYLAEEIKQKEDTGENDE